MSSDKYRSDGSPVPIDESEAKEESVGGQLGIMHGGLILHASKLAMENDREGKKAMSLVRGTVKDRFTDSEIREHFEKIRSAFRIFDSDKGGFIERDELRNIMDLVATGKSDDLEEVAKLMGINEQGLISEDGFVNAFSVFANGLDNDACSNVLALAYRSIQDGEVERLKIAFSVCDEDGSGEIDIEELCKVMKLLGENISSKNLEKMYKKLDANNDGGVDFDEFVQFMCQRKKSGKGQIFNVEALGVVSSFMSDKDVSLEESDALMEKMPMLERIGATYVKTSHRSKQLNDARKKLTKRRGSVSMEQRRAIHILTKGERISMKFVERTTYFWVGFFGWVSGVLSGAAEVIAVDQWYVDGFAPIDDSRVFSNSLTKRVLYYWLVVGGISVVATIFEVILIYFAQLKAAVKISSIAGLKLFPIDNERAFVTAALARAALELPNPQDSHMGVDPLEEASKARLFFAALMYKAKTGLTTFVIRLFFKRVVARVAVKAQSFVPFVGTLVNMFWNVAIAFKCLRQARVVALGPSVAVEVFSGLMNSYHDNPISSKVKEGVLRAIATTIVVNEEMHPNLRVLLQHAQISLKFKLGEEKYIDAVDDDPQLVQQADVCVDVDGVHEEEKQGGRASASDAGGKKKVLSPEFDHPAVEHPGSTPKFMEVFRSFEMKDRQFLLQNFALALILDGFVEKKSILMFRDLAVEAGFAVEDATWPLRWLTDMFVRGELDHNYLIDLFDFAADAEVQGRSFHKRCRRCCEQCMICFSC